MTHIKTWRERDALRAELDAIAATEPRAYEVYQKCSTKYSTLTYDTSKVPEVFVGGTVNPLFTRPMPAQDVTELVEALERVLNCCDIAECSTVPNSPGALKNARTALSKYKGAK